MFLVLRKEFLSSIHMLLFGVLNGVCTVDNFFNGKRNVILALGNLVCFGVEHRSWR